MALLMPFAFLKAVIKSRDLLRRTIALVLNRYEFKGLQEITDEHNVHHNPLQVRVDRLRSVVAAAKRERSYQPDSDSESPAYSPISPPYSPTSPPYLPISPDHFDYE